MPEDIILQETLVENGLGEKVVPIYFSQFHIPQEDYADLEKNVRAYSAMQGAQNRIDESSCVQHFTVKNYGREAFYVASPDKKHTQDICEAILNGFGMKYSLK